MPAVYEFPSAYDDLLRQEATVLLETTLPQADNHHSYLFYDPVRVLQITRLDDVPGLLQAIQAFVEQGYYVAGYFGYECGYALHKLDLRHRWPATQPLAWFGVYRRPLVFDHLAGTIDGPPELERSAWEDRQPGAETYRVSDLRFNLSQPDYSQQIDRVQEYIRAGDAYQINFTGRYQFTFDGSALALYRDLKRKQPVGYGAYLCAAGQQILCCSPELFFRIDGRRITTRPMKGTAPRGRHLAEDRQRAAWLHGDVKNRAENLMIVDLLRNDLGRISRIGSVGVPELFTVERYDTLFQMTSTVTATLLDDLDDLTLFRSLFPCGSITGAPKLRAIEIINELEREPRGVYTGSIGYFAPAAGGHPRRAVFNVAIRTVVLQDGCGVMGVGSGVLHESVAADEYAECAVKASFLSSPPLAFEIIESILWRDGFRRLDQHLQRMARSAAYFGYRYDQAAAERVLIEETARLRTGTAYKVRLLLDHGGRLRCEALPLPAAPPSGRQLVRLSATRTSPDDRFLQHKTTNRALYDRATAAAAAGGYADIIFLNQRGELTEGATSSIFIERDGALLTPALDCGVLDGIYRASVLAEHPAAREAVLTLDDLLGAEHIYLCNAIRGWREVTLDPTPLALS